MIGTLLRWLGWRSPVRIPPLLWRATLARYDFLRGLDTDEQAALKTLSEQFLAEKEIAGAHGFEITDAVCVAIAAQACLPILHLGLGAYCDWVGVVVYPGEFVVPRRIEDDDGVVHEFDDVLAGEAWSGGPVVLSWHDTASAGGDYNVVIHEFAHKLDMQNGDADGVPALPHDIPRAVWENVFFRAYDNFCQRVDNGEETRLDPYAAEEPAEFFAVVSEAFFGAPALVADDYPALYALLMRYYRQDPRLRFRAETRV
ncbi:MAG TPA: zinc-dependent peptidase [Rhodocyclaceae bacterium]|nr:zinc-dependent peptidase [Rhodocyclaceae bacterium]